MLIGTRHRVHHPDTIQGLYPTVKATPEVNDLPDNLKQMLQYAQLLMAHQLFVYFHVDLESEKV
jgi:hypothetical protein